MPILQTRDPRGQIARFAVLAYQTDEQQYFGDATLILTMWVRFREGDALMVYHPGHDSDPVELKDYLGALGTIVGFAWSVYSRRPNPKIAKAAFQGFMDFV